MDEDGAGSAGSVTPDDLAQRITVVVYRDDETDVVVLVDDQPVRVARTHLVDPGRGHARDAWEEMRHAEVADSRARGRENEATTLDAMYALGLETPWIVPTPPGGR